MDCLFWLCWLRSGSTLQRYKIQIYSAQQQLPMSLKNHPKYKFLSQKHSKMSDYSVSVMRVLREDIPSPRMAVERTGIAGDNLGTEAVRAISAGKISGQSLILATGSLQVNSSPLRSLLCSHRPKGVYCRFCALQPIRFPLERSQLPSFPCPF